MKKKKKFLEILGKRKIKKNILCEKGSVKNATTTKKTRKSLEILGKWRMEKKKSVKKKFHKKKRNSLKILGKVGNSMGKNANFDLKIKVTVEGWYGVGKNRD